MSPQSRGGSARQWGRRIFDDDDGHESQRAAIGRRGLDLRAPPSAAVLATSARPLPRPRPPRAAAETAGAATSTRRISTPAASASVLRLEKAAADEERKKRVRVVRDWVSLAFI